MFDQNKQICRRLLEEAWNKGLLNAVDETVSNKCRFHDAAFPSIEPGAASYKRHIQQCREGFPDLHCSAEDIIAEQNEVVIHWTVRGTHRGNFLGMNPTGRSIMISGTSIHRLEKGKIVELWADWNLQSLQDQLGLGMTAQEANKAFARRFIEEIWNQKKPDRISQFVTEDYKRVSPSGDLLGAKGLRQEYDTYATAFPDCHIQIDDIVCEGEHVAIRFTASGTQTGQLMGLSASAKPATVQGSEILRIVNGKVAEEYVVWDTLSLMQQIGAVPEPARMTRAQTSR